MFSVSNVQIEIGWLSEKETAKRIYSTDFFMLRCMPDYTRNGQITESVKATTAHNGRKKRNTKCYCYLLDTLHTFKRTDVLGCIKSLYCCSMLAHALSIQIALIAIFYVRFVECHHMVNATGQAPTSQKPEPLFSPSILICVPLFFTVTSFAKTKMNHGFRSNEFVCNLPWRLCKIFTRASAAVLSFARKFGNAIYFPLEFQKQWAPRWKYGIHQGKSTKRLNALRETHFNSVVKGAKCAICCLLAGCASPDIVLHIATALLCHDSLYGIQREADWGHFECSNLRQRSIFVWIHGIANICPVVLQALLKLISLKMKWDATFCGTKTLWSSIKKKHLTFLWSILLAAAVESAFCYNWPISVKNANRYCYKW